jgi:hypothetical protein
MTVIDSVISLNVATGGGGGITSGGDYANAILEVDGSTVTQNEVLDGGGAGIYVYAADPFTSGLDVTHSVITDNVAAMTAGGLRTSDAVVKIENTTIDGNQSGLACGGLFFRGGSGEVDRSTISRNVATNFAFGTGGGLCLDSATVLITNSTISGNEVAGPSNGEDFSGRGGGISLIAGALTSTPAETLAIVEDSTICDNRAETLGGGISVYRVAGTENVEVELRNTIVAENLEQGAAVLGNCIATAPAVISSADFNMADDVTCTLVGVDDLVVADVMLSPLGDHGGPTQTHGLDEGSPAVDSGDDGLCQDTDQRGTPRPLDGDGDGTSTCDRGAVESGLLLMDGFESGDTGGWSSSVP